MLKRNIILELVIHSPEDNLIETLSCQPPVLFRSNTTQKRNTHEATAHLTNYTPCKLEAGAKFEPVETIREMPGGLRNF